MANEIRSREATPVPVLRPRRRKSIRAQEILAAARQVFAEKGFEAASISEIARRADCVEGTIYGYFKNKRALLDAVLAAYYDGLIAEITPQLAAIEGTESRLRFLVTRHLQLPLEDPGVSRLIMTQGRALGEYVGSPLHGLNKRYSRFLTDTIEQGKLRGEIRPEVDAALVRDLIFGGIEHWIRNALARRRPYDAARMAHALLESLWPGLKATRSEPSTDRGPRGLQAPLREIAERLARLEALAGAGAGAGASAGESAVPASAVPRP